MKMSDQVPVQTRDEIDGLTDMCIEVGSEIIDLDLGDGFLKTFFPRQMLIDQLQKEFRAHIDGELDRLYRRSGGPATSSTINCINGFNLIRDKQGISFEALQQRVYARLEKRVADYVSRQHGMVRVIDARRKTEKAQPSITPSTQPDPSITKLRLFLWL